MDITGGISSPLPIAVPAMPTPNSVNTAAGDTASLGNRVAEVIANDLKNSGLFNPSGPAGLPGVAFNEVTAPLFPRWTSTGAQALVQGFVQATATAR